MGASAPIIILKIPSPSTIIEDFFIVEDFLIIFHVYPDITSTTLFTR